MEWLWGCCHGRWAPEWKFWHGKATRGVDYVQYSAYSAYGRWSRFLHYPGHSWVSQKKKIEKLFVHLIIEPPLVAHEGEHAFQITGKKEVVHNLIPVCKPTKVSESLEQPPASQCLPIPTLSHYFPSLAPLCVWSPAENEMSSAEGLWERRFVW